MFHHSSHNLVSLRSHDLDLHTNSTGFLFVALKSGDSVRPDEVVRFTSRHLCLPPPGLGPSAQSNLTPQVVQTLSAVDRDEPEEGQHFLFSLSEAGENLSFTLRDNKGKVDNEAASCENGRCLSGAGLLSLGLQTTRRPS